jgi:capsular polysaccharide transport system permease protein
MNQTVVQPLKKETGPETQLSLAVVAPNSRKQPKNFFVRASFVLCVIVPSMVCWIYLAMFAEDQFHSHVSFLIKETQSTVTTDLGSLLGSASSTGTTADGYMVESFVFSQPLVEAIDEKFGMLSLFSAGSDFVFSLKDEPTLEEKMNYWQRMVDVGFDTFSGILTIEVKAFSAEDALAVNDEITNSIKALINEVSVGARNEALDFARQEVVVQENRLREIQLRLKKFRREKQLLDPHAEVQSSIGVLTSLERKLVELQTAYRTLAVSLDPDAPQLVVLNNQIVATEAQLNEMRGELGTNLTSSRLREGHAAGDDAEIPSDFLSEYEEIEIERQFAQTAYTTALTGLELARNEAIRKQRYLAVFVSPTLSTDSLYPRRYLLGSLIFIGLLMTWMVGYLLYKNVKDSV